MKKTIKQTKITTKSKSVKEAVKKDILKDLPEVVLEEDDEETTPVVHEELDPEVLEALNAKKKQAKKANKFVDYIPELERGDDDFGGADDALF